MFLPTFELLSGRAALKGFLVVSGRNIQCIMEFGYQLSIFSRTEEKNGKNRNELPIRRTFRRVFVILYIEFLEVLEVSANSLTTY